MEGFAIVRAVLAGLALTFIIATHARAQSVGGSQVSGFVRDSSGGVLPGATVVMTKTDTGQSRTAVTAEDGAYSIPGLPVGPYELRVTLPGFSTYVREGIILQVGSNPSIDVTLALGEVSEQILVTAGGLLVESRSTGVGQVIDSQRVTHSR